MYQIYHYYLGMCKFKYIMYMSYCLTAIYLFNKTVFTRHFISYARNYVRQTAISNSK